MAPLPLIKPARPLVVVGFDPSMNNWGWAKTVLSVDGLYVTEVGVVQPLTLAGKQVRQNSKDLEVARQLFSGAANAVVSADLVFVEVPVGSQSARAMASYGICVGVLGSLRANQVPFIEVNPTEVKLAAIGNKTATKAQMIEWATRQHPEANWPTYQRSGQTTISEAKAEHMADALAAVYAGLNSTAFQQLLPIYQKAA